jgi:hypothetical protein
MTKGKGSMRYLGREGIVSNSNRSDISFLYEESTVKHPDFFPGDEIDIGKRAFTYAKSDGACTTVQGVEVRAVAVQTMDNIVEAVAVGGVEVTIDGGTHDALAKDELRNGYICIFNAAASITQFRGIIGNDAADANADFVVYLEAGLNFAVDTTWNAEVYRSPWSAVRLSTAVDYTKAGVPTVPVSATGHYFWVQTDGPIWVAPQIDTGLGVGKERSAFWRHDGTLDVVTHADLDAANTDQVAGCVITGSGAGIGPLFALKGRF